MPPVTASMSGWIARAAVRRRPTRKSWKRFSPSCRSRRASLSDAFGCCAEPRFVAIGGVVLDEAALGSFVDLGESFAEIRLPFRDQRARFLERALQTRFSSGVANPCFCSLPALFLGRANVSHSILLYLVSIPSCFNRSFAI